MLRSCVLLRAACFYASDLCAVLLGSLAYAVAYRIVSSHVSSLVVLSEGPCPASHVSYVEVHASMLLSCDVSYFELLCKGPWPTPSLICL